MSGLADKLNLFDADLPLERARTIPSLWYWDAELYEAERRAVFGGTWQAAARLDQLAEPGSFVTTEIAGEPLLFVRDETGTLGAFHNVCRHRAAQVMNQEHGRARRLRCRYHGWTYDLAGRLMGTPEFDGVADFCRDDNGLARLAASEWSRWAWVRSGSSNCGLRDFLSPLADHPSTSQLAALQFVERRHYEIGCNWKVFVDNYLDGGYHVNTVHPGLAAVLDYSQYRTEVAAWTSVQISPLKAAASTAMSEVRGGEAAYYWWVFPNFMLNIYEGVMDTNLVLPLGPDRCRVLFDFYFAPGTPTEFQAASIAAAHEIQLEDVSICEEVQRGLASRSFSTGRFSVRREAAGYHFHKLLAETLRGAAQ